MISNKDLRVEGGNLIINGEKHPLDPAVNALSKRANIVQGKFSALDTKLDAIEALEKTASGNPISLTGAAAAYAISNIMAIEPIQSGSGDPSPDNVRPISGISTATVETTNGEDTNTATITFGQTVYGGSVNFNTGEVTVTHAVVDMGTLTYNPVGNNLFYVLMDSFGSKKSTENIIGLKASIYNNGGILGIGQILDYMIASNSSNYFYVKDPRANTAVELVALISGETLYYELDTPVTLTLTPAELELLKGANTVSGNGANISISYIGR